MSIVEAATPPASGTLRAVLNGVNHLSRWRGRTVVIKYGGAAMELNGKDADLLVARRRPPRLAGGERVDLGFVGDVEAVNPDPLRLLQERGLIPVIAPVATGRDGETYNVNADHVAGAVAGALG